MKNTTNFLLLILIVPMLMVASCKKGDVGPAGETGTDGEKGDKGDKGDKGSTGSTGTANVIYSDWILATNFRDTIADNSNLKAADLKAPQLTTAMLNNATFLIYFNFGGGVYTLPYTSNAGGKLNTISFWPRVKHFIITRFSADNANGVALSSFLQYRYVIIPGGIKATAVTQKLDLDNYQAVKQYYNIPD
jgi:hypothetical protein